MEDNNSQDTIPPSQPSTSGYQYRKKYYQTRPNLDHDQNEHGYLAETKEYTRPSVPRPDYVPRQINQVFTNKNQVEEGVGKENIKPLPSAVLELFHSTLNFYKLPAGKSFFEFVNPLRPGSPLRLYRLSMIQLCETFPLAKAQAKKMEDACLPDDYRYDVAVVNKFENTEVLLYVSMKQGFGCIYLRLHTYTENGERQPCTYGVRLNSMDSVEELTTFVKANK